ncbi:glycosyl hydrolase [Wenyingzhuangia fucanilytica]|uniref:beta-glucosidase n=1 Tax=Wenyingzhuangia fucanilytica TaxID=1790137 RepID=A0A1B1Y954_9FLAO|nr:glycoside hydrolase family 3 N-terminal domain-containing protein [Wenyingzhuangia fucanilytica]ANW97258.1 glycosyl hydrolase [Wenyingzhuangia fucanilytica]
MKRIKTVVATLLTSVLLFSCKTKTTTQKNNIDNKVDSLLKIMSVEEKIGQMTQITLSTFLTTNTFDQHTKIPTKKIKEAIVDYKVGSVLNVISTAYDLPTWHNLLTQIQDEAQKTPNKIPVLYGIDAIHGATYTVNSTLFPHNIGLAATRNDDIVKEGAKITAKEVRASGIRWNFDPVFDIGRQPLWPRFPETFGEDLTIVTNMGVATVKGYEEDGLKNQTAVASCMKHFVGYSGPRSGKDRTPAYIPDIELWEYYLPQFKAAIDAGASTIMINSGSVNGIPGHANEYLLKTVLRDQFGFNGVAVSDWEDIIRLHTKHKIANTPKEAVKIAVNAGIDMSMVPGDYSFFTYLVELVNEGGVSMQRIDEAVGRILKLKFELGLFNHPYPEKEAVQNFGGSSYKKSALDAARESITLLKNEDNVLPISKNSKILVAGPGANSLANLNGCWSYTWQGDDESKYPKQEITIAQALEQEFGVNNVKNISVNGFNNSKNFELKALQNAAKGVDYIVLCLGENAYAESPGVINDLTLDNNQIALANAAIATNKKVILVLTEGRPRIISSFVDKIQGVLQAYWPGSQGAKAIAEIIIGKVNPSGVLPYSYPRYTGDILTYDHKFSEALKEVEPNVVKQVDYDAQWAFGHGLSYTSFEYSEIKLSSNILKGNETIEVSVEVVNTGNRDGKLAVELYTNDEFASIAPSVKRLRKYKKVSLKKGETKTVTFTLKATDLSFVNKNLKRVTEEGDFKVFIGNKETRFTYVN